MFFEIFLPKAAFFSNRSSFGEKDRERKRALSFFSLIITGFKKKIKGIARDTTSKGYAVDLEPSKLDQKIKRSKSQDIKLSKDQKKF